jgi:Fe/S biogenesis protein NfuA
MSDETTATAEATATDRPIRLTERAVEKVIEYASHHAPAAGKSLRIFLQGGNKAAFEYGFTFDDLHDDDEVMSYGDLDVIVDPYSLMYMDGSKVDFVEDLRGSGFVVQNPHVPPLMRNPLARKVKELLDQHINPSIASHGGVVSLVDVQDDKVYVQMGGGCQGCGMASVTLNQGVEVMIKERIPEISEVIDVTDHGAGENPYYEH